MHTPDLFDEPQRPESPNTSGHPALQDAESLSRLLGQWAERGWLRPLDHALVRLFHEQIPEASPLLLLLAALTSHQNGRGHVCLDLAATLNRPERALSLPPDDDSLDAAPPTPEDVLAGVSLDDCLQALAEPDLVDDMTMSGGSSPLVLRTSDEAGAQPPALLYLRRYWHYETAIQNALTDRLADPLDLPDDALAQALKALFPPHEQPADAPDWQTIACALAARNRFSIITGGPGTGKTTTVVKLLALLQSLALADPTHSHRPLRIALTAPTGKAAARLNESIAGRVENLPLDALPDPETVRQHIPTQVSTLHRLLGARPNSRHFRHHAANPLHLDLVVVDEASMVDIEMMARLLDALTPQTRLILLGDKDQLASVEAGAVLGTLCQRADAGGYRPDTLNWLTKVSAQTLPDTFQSSEGSALDQCITMLRQSHRFAADSGIGQLARRVNDGQVTAARQLLGQSDQYPDLALQSPQYGLSAWLLDGYRHYLEVMINSDPGDSTQPRHFDHWARQVLAAHNDFQLLAALRRGPQGVEALNQQVTEALERADLINAEHLWYLGRPVIVTRNDYNLKLMNGDIGITLSYPVTDADGQTRRTLRVAFLAGDGSDAVHWVLPSRLQHVETVYAMTVHKSQGSEFRHAALMVPDYHSPVLTRELVYTGITRARSLFTLVESSPAVLDRAIESRVHRVSGMTL